MQLHNLCNIKNTEFSRSHFFLSRVVLKIDACNGRCGCSRHAVRQRQFRALYFRIHSWYRLWTGRKYVILCNPSLLVALRWRCWCLSEGDNKETSASYCNLERRNSNEWGCSIGAAAQLRERRFPHILPPIPQMTPSVGREALFHLIDQSSLGMPKLLWTNDVLRIQCIPAFTRTHCLVLSSTQLR